MPRGGWAESTPRAWNHENKAWKPQLGSNPTGTGLEFTMGSKLAFCPQRSGTKSVPPELLEY